MDCKKSHSKCGAACCSMFPILKQLFDAHQDKIVNQPTQMIEHDGPPMDDDWGENPYDLNKIACLKYISHVIPITENGKCCFLNKDLSCNIYDDRPKVCRKFGDETCLEMTCCFQDKEGRIRSRQETRALGRKLEKQLESKLKILDQ